MELLFAAGRVRKARWSSEERQWAFSILSASHTGVDSHSFVEKVNQNSMWKTVPISRHRQARETDHNRPDHGNICCKCSERLRQRVSIELRLNETSIRQRWKKCHNRFLAKFWKESEWAQLHQDGLSLPNEPADRKIQRNHQSDESGKSHVPCTWLRILYSSVYLSIHLLCPQCSFLITIWSRADRTAATICRRTTPQIVYQHPLRRKANRKTSWAWRW